MVFLYTYNNVISSDSKVDLYNKHAFRNLPICYVLFLFKPIVPIFTENLREAFRTVSFGKRIFLRIYAALRFPIVPIYGGFPVKLITHIGKPIPYDPNITPEDLQRKVAAALSDLIKNNQRIPGSILQGLLARIPYFKKKYSIHHVS